LAGDAQGRVNAQKLRRVRVVDPRAQVVEVRLSVSVLARVEQRRRGGTAMRERLPERAVRVGGDAGPCVAGEHRGAPEVVAVEEPLARSRDLLEGKSLG